MQVSSCYLVVLDNAACEVRFFNGKGYVLQEALRADFAFIKAWKVRPWTCWPQ